MTLAIALDLAARLGLPVFPCLASKAPAIPRSRGGNGFKDASTDYRRVRELWALAGASAALVGVPTGPSSGFDVLDIDTRHGGHLWEAEHSVQLGETRIHCTPSGGRHWLFHHVDGVANSAGRIAPGVDTRGLGGYVCFPPSPGYSVLHEADIAPWPLWLLWDALRVAEAVAKPVNGTSRNHTRELPGTPPAAITDRRVAGQIAALLDNVRTARDGQKHVTLRSNGVALGGYIARAGWTEAQAIEALVAALPDTVKDRALARRTAAWAVAQGAKRPQTLPDRDRLERRPAA
jgi:Bifunctional DNA primase/polymerase, N-terminal